MAFEAVPELTVPCTRLSLHSLSFSLSQAWIVRWCRKLATVHTPEHTHTHTHTNTHSHQTLATSFQQLAIGLGLSSKAGLGALGQGLGYARPFSPRCFGGFRGLGFRVHRLYLCTALFKVASLLRYSLLRKSTIKSRATR